MTGHSTGRGILFMVATTLVFSVQDGISRHLAEDNSVFMVVMVRYWFFAAIVVAISARQAGGLARVARSRLPWMQAFRGVLLVAEICVTVVAFVMLGLVETHAIFASYPLLVAALSGAVLGERVGWRRWCAIAIGFVGVLVILWPGSGMLSPAALVPVLAALMFALYSLLTRYVGRVDPAATSFFWTGITGVVAITPLGLWHWEPMPVGDWGWMGCLCVTGAAGHYMMIRAYALAEASAIQPFSFLQLVFAAIIGITVFGEILETNVAVGTAIVTGAALFTVWREGQVRGRRAQP
ncbi:MAG: DMT family transporter [Pseudomonadota bacterium]